VTAPWTTVPRSKSCVSTRGLSICFFRKEHILGAGFDARGPGGTGAEAGRVCDCQAGASGAGGGGGAGAAGAVACAVVGGLPGHDLEKVGGRLGPGGADDSEGEPQADSDSDGHNLALG
jgi:hypothetical protein